MTRSIHVIPISRRSGLVLGNFVLGYQKFECSVATACQSNKSNEESRLDREWRM
jgi:hypothetical protein